MNERQTGAAPAAIEIRFRFSCFFRIASVACVPVLLSISGIGALSLALIWVRGTWRNEVIVVVGGIVVVVLFAVFAIRIGQMIPDFWREYVLDEHGIRAIRRGGVSQWALSWGDLTSCRYDSFGKMLVLRFAGHDGTVRLINPDVAGRLNQLKAAAAMIRRYASVPIESWNL